MSASLATCNIAEVLVAVLLWKGAIERSHMSSQKSSQEVLPDLASPAVMLQFVLFAVLLAPAVAALIGSAWYHVAYGSPFWIVAAKWFSPHALGMAVMTPLTLAIWNPKLKSLFGREHVLQTIGMTLLVIVVSLFVFEQTHYRLVFLLFPLLMFVVFEMGILGAVLATFEISLIAALFTLHGHGPFWMDKGATMEGSVLLLQSAILVLMVSVVPFAATWERQHDLRKRLREGMTRYRLLADHSRDIVVLSSLEGHRLYVSPAVQDVLGWTQQEWSNKDSVDFMHRDDVAAFQTILKEMLHGEDQRIFRYRTRHKQGHYVWVEASLRSMPDEITGRPNAYVANIRDISQRVEVEQQLEAAYLQVQEQAQRDSLTGLSNRRRFDTALETEWRRGRRTGDVIAMLMVDIDHFKQINDTYGHRAGDYCLQSLAALLQQTARRPSDLIARYGGEEFAVLLPDVDFETALVMAEGLCLKVRQHSIDAGIGRHLLLTVSVGVAAMVPDKHVRADALVEAADQALYAAKELGRDRVMPLHGNKIHAVLRHQVQ